MTRPEHRAVRRAEFATSDPERAQEFVRRVYGGTLEPGGDDRRDVMTVSQVDVGAFLSGDVRAPGDLRFAVEGDDYVIVSVAVEGAVELTSGRSVERLGRGDVFVANQPGSAGTCRTVGARVTGITLPLPLVRTAGADLSAGRTLLSPAPVDAAAARQWRRTAGYVRSLVADPAACSPLVIGSAGRLLAATALAVFPPGPSTELVTGRDPLGAPPAAVRRAIAFIEADPAADLAVVDVAVAARVSVRVLQLAFRRHLGTTPMAYLRRVPLDRAHQDLLAAGPDRPETVTSIATRWGFSHPGRFAAAYRHAYGRSPGDTLRL